MDNLQLGLYEQDLWVNFCFCKFKELPIWPSRTIVDANMPLIFNELDPSTRCIIDATEMFIQKPQNSSAQQLTTRIITLLKH